MKLIFLLTSFIGLIFGMSDFPLARDKFFPKNELQKILGPDYPCAQQIAETLPFIIKDTCYNNIGAITVCANLLKVLVDIKKNSSTSQNLDAINCIKTSVSEISKMNNLSPQTTNELMNSFLQKKIIYSYLYDYKKNYEQEVRKTQAVINQFPNYLKELCHYRYTKKNDNVCYQLAHDFYRLQLSKDQSDEFCTDTKEIQEKLKKIPLLPCFNTGLYTQEQLFQDFIKAAKKASASK